MNKKQFNVGFVDAESVQKIKLAVEKWAVDIMEDGYTKLNKRQLQVDTLEVFLPRARLWVNTALSIKEAKLAATKQVVRQRMKEDVNLKLRDLMNEIARVIDEHLDKVLREVYG
jgi:hypothetical protein